MFEDQLVQWNGSSKARNVLDNGALWCFKRLYCICLMTAGDKGQALSLETSLSSGSL